MYKSPAEVMAQYLVNQSLAVYPDHLGPDKWLVTIDNVSAEHPFCIGAMNTGSLGQGRAQNTGQQFFLPRVQFLIASKRQALGWDRGKQLQANFEKIGLPSPGTGWQYVTVDGQNYRIDAVHVLVDLVTMGTEADTKRFMYSLNTQLNLRSL